MDPHVLRANFALALFILFGALLILPFEDMGSAAFVVTVLTIVVGGVFAGVIWLVARWSTPRVPSDNRRRTGYNGPRPDGPASVVGPPAKERDDD